MQKYEEIVPVNKVENIFSKEETGLLTGLHLLDRKINGLQKCDYILIGARPGMGKSSLAITTAMALGLQKCVYFISLEMSARKIVQRIVSQMVGIPYCLLISGEITTKEHKKVEQVKEHLNNYKIVVDDSARLSPYLLRDKVQFVKERFGLDCIILDYLQLMRGRSMGNSVQDMTDVSRELKAIAKEFAVPLLALSQLSRNLEYRDDKRPRLADLRETGALEQDADKVIFIYRPAYYNRDEDDKAAELIIAKQRDGETGTVNVEWLGETMSFRNASRFV